jgi:PAS domain S-box-containing protein
MAKAMILYFGSQDKAALDELFSRLFGSNSYLHLRHPVSNPELDCSNESKIVILSAAQPSATLDEAFGLLLSSCKMATISVLASDVAKNSGMSSHKFDLVACSDEGLRSIGVMVQRVAKSLAENNKLRLAQRRYKLLMNNLHGCYFSSNNDSDRTMLELHPKFEKISGYPVEDVIRNKRISYSDLIFPQDREQVWLLVQQSIKKQKTYEVEYRLKTASGQIRYISETGFETYSNGNGSVIEGVMTDITHTRRLEMQLETVKKIMLLSQESHSLAEMIELIENELAAVIFNCSYRLAFYDRHARAFMVPMVENGEAFFKKQPLDKTLDAMVVLRNRTIMLKRNDILKLKRQGKLRSDHAEPKVFLGVPLTIDGKAHGIISIQNFDNEDSLHDSDRSLIEFIAVQVVTAMIQKVASDETGILVEALQQNPEAIMIIDLHGYIIYANQHALNNTGLSQKCIIGSLPAILNPKYNDAEQVRLIWDTLHQHNQWEGEFQNRNNNGQMFWEFALITPYRDYQSNVTHYIYVQERLTERKKTEAELIIARRRAEESDKLKTAFLSNMSHEIRTPMNAIMGFTEMLATDQYTPQEHSEFINLILENGHKLLSTIDEIIDIAKIEAGQFRIEAAKCSANKILYDNFNILKTLQQKYQKENLKLIARQNRDNENVLFVSDAHRINQVLINLMENALKYTFDGFIEVGYRVLREEDTEYICFYVKDSGTGIARERMLLIFDRFSQASENYMSTQSDNGLGLAISRNVAHLMGGDLRVESAIGKGSAFYFMLPLTRTRAEILQPPPAEPQPEPHKLTWPEKTVLITEDEDSNFTLLEVMLQKTRVKIHRAYNGKQAVDYVLGGNNVDLVLMDIRMPVMNGYQATEHIKAFNPALPVIIQTAFAMSGDRETGLAAGCDEYLPKPIRASELYRLMQKFL